MYYNKFLDIFVSIGCDIDSRTENEIKYILCKALSFKMAYIAISKLEDIYDVILNEIQYKRATTLLKTIVKRNLASINGYFIL